MAGRIALIAALSAVAALPTTAHATFPGTNGKIVYEGPGLSGVSNTSIFSMNPDGDAKTNLTSSPGKGVARRGGAVGSYDPSYSANGRKIVFARVSQGSFSYDVWVMNADGSGASNLTSSDTVQDQDPAFSPDGSKIVFTRELDNGDPQLYVMNANGGGATPVGGTGTVTFPSEPEFSPDGSQIVFRATAPPATESDIFTIGANGQGLANLTSAVSGSSREPSWAPDGTRIAFANQPPAPGDPNILVIGAGGGATTDLTGTVTGASVSGPTFSPDGTLIAYDRDDNSDGNSDIFTMRSSDGLQQTNITSDTASEDDTPNWGPVPTGDPPPTGDTTPPETLIVKTPLDSEKTKAKLKFTSNEPGSTFECALKGKGVDQALKQFKPCNSGKAKYKNLDLGKKKFLVRATDSAGNVDPSPAKAKWKVLD